jgi:hypothetical protein
MTDPLSRRTALSMLGLGATVAVVPEDFSAKANAYGPDKAYSFGVAGQHVGGGRSAEVTRARMTAALRRLADDIDAGGTHVQSMRLTSDVQIEDFLKHTLQVEFSLREDQLPVG